MNANIKNSLSRIENHETRIQNLETQNREKDNAYAAKDGDIKSKIIALLVKGLILAIVIIGSFTGAAGLITKILVL